MEPTGEKNKRMNDKTEMEIWIPRATRMAADRDNIGNKLKRECIIFVDENVMNV